MLESPSSRGLRVVSVVALIAALTFGVSACGDDNSVSQEELQQATEEARQDALNEAQLDDLREKVEALQKEQGTEGSAGTTTTPPEGSGDTGGGLPADAESCGAGVYASSATTSCEFALNVASDYYASPDDTFTSYSPTTGEAYTMSCSGTAPVVCTGGNDAAVYIP